MNGWMDVSHSILAFQFSLLCFDTIYNWVSVSVCIVVCVHYHDGGTFHIGQRYNPATVENCMLYLIYLYIEFSNVFFAYFQRSLGSQMCC